MIGGQRTRRPRATIAAALAASAIVCSLLAAPLRAQVSAHPEPAVTPAGDAAPGEPQHGVQVSLRPQRLRVGAVAELTFLVDRSSLRVPRFEPHFSLDNLEVVGGPTRSDSFLWENGRMRRVIALSWYVAPARPGRARVRDVTVALSGGTTIQLPDQEAAVEEGQATGTAADPAGRAGSDPLTDLLRGVVPLPGWPAPPPREPQVLLRAELSAPEPWVGQQVLYTLFLLVERRREGEGRLSIETIFPRKVPAFQGFWAQEVPLPESGRAELVELEGTLWWRQPVLQRALFAYEPGDHAIEVAEADLRLLYFRPLGFGLGEEPVRPPTLRRTSNAPLVTVRALPPAPPGFSGAVGHFSARAELRPHEIRAGEGALLTVELVGDGNVSGLPDATLPTLPALQRSPAQEATQQVVVDTRVETRRSWTWTLVPARAGSWQVPGASWVTFDPTAGAYRTVAAEALSLTARPAAPAAAPPVRPALPAAAPAGWERHLPAVAIGIGAAGVLAVASVLWRRRRRRDRPARRRLVSRLAAALDQGQPRQAAGAAEEAWREFLGARFALPADAQPAHLPRMLAAQGLQPADTGELLRLFDDLHYLRYAPQLASTDSLQRDLLERSRRLARRLA